jgi:hypothetical protein
MDQYTKMGTEIQLRFARAIAHYEESLKVIDEWEDRELADLAERSIMTKINALMEAGHIVGTVMDGYRSRPADPA